MSSYWKYFAVTLLIAALCFTVQGGEKANIIVAAKGGADFTSIQGALNSIPSNNTKRVVILIRSGVYDEKIFIEKSFVTLVGEDRDSTRIVFPELRENWNKEHNGSDWGSGVVNIDTNVTDLTLANLTVYNNYGWKCGDFNKHQFAIRGSGTRIMLLHCNVISDGGDALSLWNKQNGMYYHADCFFEGWVDYVCPRGWCYVTDSKFFGHNKSASIWHDGDYDKNQKFVIVNSRFDGVPGFPLGRNHRDGQIFLLNCRFSEYMADQPIYHPPTSKTEWKWGARHYYWNCHRDGGDYEWFENNLEKAESSQTEQTITAKWTFGGLWDPEATMPSVLPFSYLPAPKHSASGVAIEDVKLSWVAGRNADSHTVYFGTTKTPERKGNQKSTTYEPGALKPQTTYYWRVDAVTDSGIVAGWLWSFRTK